jgi:sigma-E factor negative regulatory protein RseA
MEKISELMDGEIEGQESSLLIRRLGKDPQMIQTWETYHLIRDVLRDEAGGGFGLAQRVHELLKAEPTVVAPQTRLVARVTRYSLPMAAAVAGVAVVGWLAVASQPFFTASTSIASKSLQPVPVPASQELVMASRAKEPVEPLDATTVAATAQAIPTVAANGQFNDYILAHQEFSASTTFQGGASYTRLPYEDPGNPQ